MFEQLIESSSKKVQNRRRWLYFTVTAVVWVAGMTATVLAGVLAYDGRLNNQFQSLVLVIPSTPAPPPPLAAGPSRPPQSQDHQPAEFMAPRQTPTEIHQPSNLPPIISTVGSGPGSDQGVPGGDPHGVPGGVPDSPGVGAPPVDSPPPPTTPPVRREEQPPTPKAPRISTVLQGTAVRRVQPAYPGPAKAMGVSGPVVVEAVVDEEGNVISARAISGHPLLRRAAEEAARGWKWNPTKLNNVPVQVVGTITFNFVL